MRSPAARLSLLAAALLLACAGCVALGGPAPPRLDAPPDQYGLLVVRVEMAYEGPLNFEGTLGSAVKLDSARLVRTETRTRIEQIAMPPLVVFQLLPGTYRLASVHGSFRTGDHEQQFQHWLDPEVDAEVGPIEITAGRVTYVGELEVTGKQPVVRASLAYRYDWDRDPAREAESLEILAERYEGSPWLPVIAARLTELASQP